MIIQLTGNVTYPITLDPTVWIFDDRKIIFEQAFEEQLEKKVLEDSLLKKTSERWDREVQSTSIYPPVNKSISKAERNELFQNTYVMPIVDFIGHAEVKQGAQHARIFTNNNDQTVSLQQLTESLLLFAKDGKPITDDGPVHLYFADGSNKHNPIIGLRKIVIE